MTTKRGRRAITAAALLILAGCKRCDQSHDTPARVVTIDAAPVAVAADAGVPSGDLRGDVFVFDSAVYHFGAPAPGADAAARKLLDDAGFDVRDAALKEAPSRPTVVIARPTVGEFAPPSLETLKYRGKGLSDEEKVRLQKATAVTIFSFTGPGKDALASYRVALRALLALEKTAPGILWDEDARVAMGRDAWAARLDDWTGDVPRVDRQFSIDGYRDGELLRIVTLGMRRFALPDVVVSQVTSHDFKSMGTLVNIVCQTLVERSALPRPGEIDVAVATLTNTAARAYYLADFEEGGTGGGTLALAKATPAEGDSDNRLLEVVFPGPAGQLQERQNHTLASILGAHDSLVRTRHDPEILAASARARAKAIALKTRFASGAPQLEQLTVKAPFKTRSGGNEWMWVEVVRWNGSTIQGVLQNDPYEVPGLKAGARVEVEESSIFDYIYRRADGSAEGNETAALLEGAAE